MSAIQLEKGGGRLTWGCDDYFVELDLLSTILTFLYFVGWVSEAES